MLLDWEDLQLILLGGFILGVTLIVVQSFLHRLRSYQSSVLRNEEEFRQLLPS